MCFGGKHLYTHSMIYRYVLDLTLASGSQLGLYQKAEFYSPGYKSYLKTYKTLILQIQIFPFKDTKTLSCQICCFSFKIIVLYFNIKCVFIQQMLKDYGIDIICGMIPLCFLSNRNISLDTYYLKQSSMVRQII